jgi:HSP20 family molecular chaperone IbpA
MKSKRAFHEQPLAPPPTLLSLRNPAALRWEIQQVQLAIARRAYELFEARRCEHGHDWEDWFRAESELLRPVSISTSESANQISIRANVLGFEENELKVSVEPHRIMILGKKQINTTETEGGKVEYIDWYPDQILQFIDLPAQVIPENAVVELQAGQLKFELPKAERKVEAAVTAA